MIKPERIWDATELTIGQLYMFSRFEGHELERGYCTKISETEAEFRIAESYCTTQKVNLRRSDPWNKEKLYMYNALIFNKYNKLLEQQKQEREDLLLGKSIVVQEISKKKWYERFLKRKVK